MTEPLMEVELMRVGKHGDFEVTEDTIDALLANTELPFPLDDPNFGSSARIKDGPLGQYREGVTMGWFRSIAKQNGKLVGSLELTDLGKALFDPNMATVIAFDMKKLSIICAAQH